MKKIIIVFILSLLTGMASFSQEITPDKVPTAVKQSFARQFPDAKMVQYEQNNTDYIISFLEQAKQFIVTYNSSGKVLETDKEITQAGIPKEVLSSVTKNFPEYQIVTVVRREAVDKGVCYEMDLKKDDAGYSVRFSDKGEILQKEARKVEFKVTTKGKK
jgi:glycine betaine/choline ABC-type transport system substrate-binding protein